MIMAAAAKMPEPAVVASIAPCFKEMRRGEGRIKRSVY